MCGSGPANHNHSLAQQRFALLWGLGARGVYNCKCKIDGHIFPSVFIEEYSFFFFYYASLIYMGFSPIAIFRVGYERAF